MSLLIKGLFVFILSVVALAAVRMLHSQGEHCINQRTF